MNDLLENLIEGEMQRHLFYVDVGNSRDDVAERHIQKLVEQHKNEFPFLSPVMDG